MKRFLLLIAVINIIYSATAQNIVLLDTVYVDALQNSIVDLDRRQSNHQEGKLVLVPDSLVNDVKNFIAGKSKIIMTETAIDINEKVIVNTDTIPLFIKERNFGRYDRGLLNYLYIPKGEWAFGLTASYGGLDATDLKVLDLVADCDLGGTSFSIRPSISYFIKNNLSVGMRFVYSNSSASVNSLKIDIDEDMNFDISGVHYHNESYSAAVFARRYIGLGRNSRFGVFNEMELSFASGNANFIRKFNDEPKDTRTTYMDVRLNFSPGITVFMMKNVSFNVSFGVFGFYLRNERQTTNGISDIEKGNRFTSGANFKFNLFNINFGLGIHI